MLRWSLFLVREQRRERNSFCVVDKRRHCRYFTALRSVGEAGGRPLRDLRRLNSTSVKSRGGAPFGRYMRWSHVRMPYSQSGVSRWRMLCVGG